MKEPNAPYPPNPNAPSTYARHPEHPAQDLRFSLATGGKGTAVVCLDLPAQPGRGTSACTGWARARMLNDFRLKTVYGVGGLAHHLRRPSALLLQSGGAGRLGEQGRTGPLRHLVSARLRLSDGAHPPSHSDGVLWGARQATVRFGDHDYGMTVTSRRRRAIPFRARTTPCRVPTAPRTSASGARATRAASRSVRCRPRTRPARSARWTGTTTPW